MTLSFTFKNKINQKTSDIVTLPIHVFCSCVMQQVDVQWVFARVFISGGEASEPALTTSAFKASLCRVSRRHCH